MHGAIPKDLGGAERFTPSQRVLVRMLVVARRERSRRFAAQSRYLTDPAWDILVDLAAAGLTGRSVSVSSACLAALVPQTTALRYVRLLEADGLVERVRDVSDGRRFLLGLTSKGWSQFHGYVSWLDGQPPGTVSPAPDGTAARIPSVLDGPRRPRSVAPRPLRSVDEGRSGA